MSLRARASLRPRNLVDTKSAHVTCHDALSRLWHAVTHDMPLTMTLTHVKTRAKQRQQEAEWRATVHADNLRLLKKMERIGTRKITDLTKPASYRTSMQSVAAAKG